jgi:hypothetical protein
MGKEFGSGQTAGKRRRTKCQDAEGFRYQEALMNEVIFVCDESGAKGFADKPEQAAKENLLLKTAFGQLRRSPEFATGRLDDDNSKPD